MSNRILSKTTRQLIAAKELINTPDKWCKYSLMDNHGARCIFGAIVSVSKNSQEYNQLWDIFFHANFQSPANFNDSEKTTHKDVMKAMDKTIQYSINTAW